MPLGVEDPYHPFHSVDGNNACNWRYNWNRGGTRRPICTEYSGNSGNCRGASGSPTLDATCIRYGEFAYIPPPLTGLSTIYICNATDEPLEIEYRNRNDRIRPPLMPKSTTKVIVAEFAPPEMALVKTVRILQGWGAHTPRQYKSGYFLINQGTTYTVTMHEDRLLIDDKLGRK
jgi:hypothetical protein